MNFKPDSETNVAYRYYGAEELPIQKRYGLLNRITGKYPLINIGLFILTIGTTYLVQGLSYSISIVSILLAHEMGHYLMCRKYRIDATLPYFIPVPLPPFGTMGAFIKMKSPIPDKKALFDVGAAGPIAGLFVTIPILIIGMYHSSFIPKVETQDIGIYLGESLLFKQIANLVLGPEPAGFDTMLHPMAYAGWAGLFVTALNLLPIGQLDGGHILYSLFGRQSEKIYKFVLLIFTVVCAVWYPGWLLLILLLLWFGFKHPPPIYEEIELDDKRKLLGYVMFIVFILSFVPVPFHIK
ncbi:MAG: site-2 protease family protein [bacterium]|nr:site-2 protease family protein [bacterium]